MKKVVLLLLVAIFSFAVQAKHLEFMGIPITGSITSFQSKLIAKGCSVSKDTNQYPIGIRAFKGIFAGKDCDILVWYNPKTKIVYRVRAIADGGSSLDNTHNIFYYYKKMLNRKYEDEALTSDMLEDSENDEFEFDMVVMQPPIQEGAQILGTISMHIIEYDDYPTTYGVAITYEDLEGSSKNEENSLNDL